MERIQVVLLQQAGPESGKGRAAVEVCPNNGVTAGQVGQVGPVAGTAEADSQTPPGGGDGSRKRNCPETELTCSFKKPYPAPPHLSLYILSGQAPGQ